MNGFGYFRVAACVPDTIVGQPSVNAKNIVKMAAQASGAGAKIIVFPELSLTGCTAGDLFFSQRLINETLSSTDYVIEHSRDIDALLIIGLPVADGETLYDTSALVHKGRVLGVVASADPYDNRHFSGPHRLNGTLELCGVQIVPSDTVEFSVDGASISIRAFRSLHSSDSDIVICPAALPETAGLAKRLTGAAVEFSRSGSSAIILASAGGSGESTTDYLFAGHALIAENGTELASSHGETGITIADVDIELLHNARRKSHTGRTECAGVTRKETVRISLPHRDSEGLMRPVSPTPFLTGDEVYAETFGIQAKSLALRMKHIGIKRLVIGISGGLDSTLALLVCAQATDMLGYDRDNIIGITMPGFGTTGRTYSNAVGMMESLGIDRREINIKEACLLHLKDIGHDIAVHDSAYENAQARERTQILMDTANRENALVVGTGDLSELALGWCTYNGDHMSMYAVNAGIPKTLIPGIIEYASGLQAFSAAKGFLLDVIDTPITPELLPPDGNWQITQKTEEIIGPYELHDFFLYHTVVNGFAPSKIQFLAEKAFIDKYDASVIGKWLELFIKRFFNNQFKRSCMPDGPRVGAVSLSPRCGWEMPSDISYSAWISDIG